MNTLLIISIILACFIAGLIVYDWYRTNQYFKWRYPDIDKLPPHWKKVLCETKSGNLVGAYISKDDSGKVIIVTDPDFHFEDYDNYEVYRWKYLR